MARTRSSPHLYLTMMVILIISVLLSPFTTAQFGFGNANAGTGTDPVAILLQSPTAIRQCYSFSGQLNNAQQPQWGAVGEPLLRPEGSSYHDNDWSQFPEGPNPRSISNILAHETCADSTRNGEACYNDWFWLWGQWVDHDLTHVPTFPRPANGTTDLSVPVASTDPFLSGRQLPLIRSLVDQNSPTNPTDQINLATAFLDQSQLYGSTIDKGDSIRTFRNGMIKSTVDGFMPVLTSRLNLDLSGVPTFEELGAPSNKDQFLCADMRCNQHAPMASLQAMYIREHNRIALALSQANHPAYNNDESIYQAARAVVIAINQAITYNEFLPLLLGKFNLPAYSGYKPDVRPTISNVFSTAGFRTIHSMVPCEFKEMTGTGTTLRSASFASSFFDSTWIRGAPAQPNRNGREANAYQTIMNALGQNPTPRYDHKVSPILRSLLFSNIPQSTASAPRRPEVAFDVVSSDIQRGRDHGLLSYREMRNKMGWGDVTKMEDITLQLERVNILKSIYGESVDDIDLMVGLLTEDPLDGALGGPVTTSIVQDQFRRIRDGDRCWYENQFQGPLLALLRGTKLKHIVDRNFNTATNPFASEVVVGTRPVRQPVTISPVTAAPAPTTTTTTTATGTPAVTIPLPTNTPVTTFSASPPQPVSALFNPVITLQQLESEKGSSDDDIIAAEGAVGGSGGEGRKKQKHHRKKQEGQEDYEDDTFGDHPYDQSRRDGRNYILDSTEDKKRAELDSKAHASRRYQNGQSRMDNGRGTRPAQQFDDIVGWECHGETCFAVALESDPVISDDPEVLEFIRQYREFKRQRQQQQQDALAPTQTNGSQATSTALVPTDPTVNTLSSRSQTGHLSSPFASNAFIRNNGFNTFLFSHPNTMETLSSLHSPRFSTLQTSNPRVGSTDDFATAGATQLIRLTSGRMALSPLTGILQTDQRVRLAAQVTATQTAENIFLVPGCRSRV